ncbi:MAG: aminopeptidase, partial [Bacteroidota bacterium]
ELKAGERLYVRSTTLAEPLVREVYRTALEAGAAVVVDLDFREQNRLSLTRGSKTHLEYVSPVFKEAVSEFEAYLYIRAPFNLREDQNVDQAKSKIRQAAIKPYYQKYFERTGTRALKRNLCQYPTIANAQQAGMSLEEYEQFIFNACKLMDDDPIASWKGVHTNQQRIVDLLNSRQKVRYVGDQIDIEFSTKGRTWINSDGQTNMPSGEVYTSPVEDSVNGTIHFTFPGVYMGHEVEGVTLWVKEGYIEKWEAKKGKAFLDHIFSIDGARRFGEAAIGTNYNITRHTKNILFDEKIGGTVHMAIGQSYLQAGGKNESSVHWDMITDMQKGGQIFADDELIYENGQFIF